jgi:hypothetical protein
MSLALTRHAQARMRQRAISPAVLEALLDYGRSRYLHSDGCELVYFDRKARERLVRESPSVAREIGRLGKTYAVLGGDGTVVTVGHRFRRIPRG